MNLIEQLLLDDRSITRGEKFLLVALSLREHATNTNLTLSHRAQTIILAERFERTLQLPAEIDHERVSATLEHGVLTVKLPKKSLPPRVKIAIQ